jgi:23S rRNA pseudouridine1911/1915/1917 synthase
MLGTLMQVDAYDCSPPARVRILKGMLDVIFEDHHLIVVNKPAPLLTQAPEGVPSLEQWVKDYLKVKYAKPSGVYLGVPHRLDRPVTGVILFCRNTKCAQRMQTQFEARSVRKVYRATVEGHVADDAGEWQDRIRKVPGEARVERATEADLDAKQAIVKFRVLERLTNQTRLELEPLTGRMHQLRVQTAWRGHPILGDALYGSTTAFGPQAELPREACIALHAYQLTIQHPFTKAEMTFTADEKSPHV